MVHEERLGPYLYRWDEGCFPLGADSLALGEFCVVKPRDRVLDLGCGAGLLLLLCARREADLSLTGVDIDPHAVGMARRNLAENGLLGTIFAGNVGEIALPQTDLVVSNPPWYPRGTGKAGGPGRMGGCPLPDWCAAAAKALVSGGRFAAVYRPEGLVDLLTALRGAGLEPKRLRLCRHAPDKSPSAVLVEAVKGGRPGLSILPDLLSFSKESRQRKLP